MKKMIIVAALLMSLGCAATTKRQTLSDLHHKTQSDLISGKITFSEFQQIIKQQTADELERTKRLGVLKPFLAVAGTAAKSVPRMSSGSVRTKTVQSGNGWSTTYYNITY